MFKYLGLYILKLQLCYNMIIDSKKVASKIQR